MTISTDPNTNQDAVSQEVLGHQALLRLMPELKALPSEDLKQVQLDIPSAVATVLGSLPEIRALRADIEAAVKDFDFVSFDKLEDYALALTDAHTEFLIATKPMDDLDQMIDEGGRLKAKFAADANACVVHGLIDPKKLAEVQGGVGFKVLASDLSIYSKVFTQSWPAIQNKVGTTLADIERAGKLAQRIIRVVGTREQATQNVAEATDVRTRVYTLFMRTYDYIRRAVTFLRWAEADAEDIAPSLFADRSRRKKAPAPQPAPVPAANQPTAAPAGTATTQPSNAGGAAAAPSGANTSESGAPNATAIPGGEPFLS
jgi:hypothetical protein